MDWGAGAPDASVLRPSAGAVSIFFGAAVMDTELAPGATLVGGSLGANLCQVAAGGDLDGDGAQDLLLGAPTAQEGSVSPGVAHVVFGPVEGNFDLSKNGVRLPGERDGDRAGSALMGAGDVNGDGFDDILVGAFDYPGAQGRGAVYLMLGAKR